MMTPAEKFLTRELTTSMRDLEAYSVRRRCGLPTAFVGVEVTRDRGCYYAACPRTGQLGAALGRSRGESIKAIARLAE